MEKTCPKCGAKLTKRLAKRGKHAGQHFWGCLNYPECNYIMNINEENLIPSIEYNHPNHPDKSNNSVALKAREIKDGYVAEFIQSTACPEFLLNFTKSNNINLSSINQWRIDYPINRNFRLADNEQLLISLLEKMILRGNFTLLTPSLEEKLLGILNIRGDVVITDGMAINGSSKMEFEDYWFDSEEESLFYHELLPEIIGKEYHNFTIPQIYINSLLDVEKNEFKNQRADFLISFPNSGLKLIVEIDGSQHQNERIQDTYRDSFLIKNGYTVVRIPTYEINTGKGKMLTNLSELIGTGKIDLATDNSSKKLLNAFRCSHQIQFALLRAIKNGHLSIFNSSKLNLVTDLNELDDFDTATAENIFKFTVIDFFNTIQHLSSLLKIDKKISIPNCLLINEMQVENLESILISFNNNIVSSCPSYYIQNIHFPKQISFPECVIAPLANVYNIPPKEDLEYFLQYLFRKNEFREGQYRALIKILNKEDCLILLPTGAGKSIVYQLASFLMPGITIIVDPIIALMNDQVQNLSNVGIDRCIAISSEIDNHKEKETALRLLSRGDYLFTFVSPERFLNEGFRQSISALASRIPIPLIVIDEAHCVSEWGHDFRPAYLSLADNARKYCIRNAKPPVLIGLTGTASVNVLNDVKRELKIDLTITPESFNREELNFAFQNVDSKDKPLVLEQLLTEAIPTFFNTRNHQFPEADSGLVFCPHVDTKFGVVKVKAEIDNWIGEEKSRIYSGKPPRNIDESHFNEYKKATARDFKNNVFPLLVCTKSFGMGIDKANIHYTIHYNLPPSIEAFYQEAGRAGRDRGDSLCYIIYSYTNGSENNYLLNPTLPIESIHSFIEEQKRNQRDDISRMLFFHCKAFMGVKQELSCINDVINGIHGLAQKGIKEIYLNQMPDEIGKSIDDRKNNIEKAIIRLVKIGAISDYTYDYSKRFFTISITGISKIAIIESFERHISTYLVTRGKAESNKLRQFENLDYNNFVVKAAELLLIFIYDVVERSRRAALTEMLRAVEDSSDETQFRERILNYLQPTPYARNIEDMIFAENMALSLAFAERVFDTILSKINAKELRGQIERYLESYPDHPLLRILHALVESAITESNERLMIEEFASGIQFGHKKYNFNEEELLSLSTNFLSRIAHTHPDTSESIINQLLIYWEEEEMELRKMSIGLIEELPIEVTSVPAWALLDQLNKKANTILELLV